MIVDERLSKAKFERDSAPLLQSPESYSAVGIRVIRVEFPVIEVGIFWKKMQCEITLHIEADEYDYLPVRGWWIDENGKSLRKGGGFIPRNIGFQTEDGHPSKHIQSWFCFRGWREYHDHESHQDIPWASIRHNPQYRLPGIIIQLSTDLNRPEVQPI